MEGKNQKIDVMVDHPAHYKSETGLEAIDVIEAFTFDLKGTEAVCTGNVLKYICRWPHKNGLQDLKKARWYLDRLINHIEKLEEEDKDLHRGEFRVALLNISRDDFYHSIMYTNETFGNVTVANVKKLCDLKSYKDDTVYGWSGPFEILFEKTEKGQDIAIFPNPIKL